MSTNSNRTVYSTESGRHCPHCGMPLADCVCKSARSAPVVSDGVIRVRREKQGRGGKEVTVVRNYPGSVEDLKKHAAILKKKLGTGGSEKNGVLEIQGDRVDSVIDYFKNLGMKIKKDGG